MILIDLNQLIITDIFSEVIDKKLDDENLIRHTILNSIRAISRKYKNKYGEIVICCDSGDYWRRDIFPYYKLNRIAIQDKSPVDWKLLHTIMRKLKKEFVENLPYKVLLVDKTEADDIIAVLSVFHSNTEKIMIISSDKDFLQLHKYKNIEQYSPILKKNIKVDSPVDYLKEHIIRGDRGDGIPNFLSGDNVFLKKERQKSVTKKNLEIWMQSTPEEFCTTEEMLRNYKRNEMLIDLEKIPSEYQKKIVECFANATPKPKSHMLNYLISNRLTNLIEVVDEF